jgi:translocation protein SEC63
VIVPPIKITEVPVANPDLEQDYRTYQLQVQAPPNVQTFHWKLYIISDTFVGEEISRDIVVSLLICLGSNLGSNIGRDCS